MVVVRTRGGEDGGARVVLRNTYGVNSIPQADTISNLPGQPHVKFQQYSSYITVKDQNQRALFYYFVEAEKHPTSKPVVIWLNGVETELEGKQETRLLGQLSRPLEVVLESMGGGGYGDLWVAMELRLCSLCYSVLHYDHRNLEIAAISILGSLVNSSIRVLVYSGDQDSVIPLLGSRSLVNGLAKQLGLNTTVAYRAWFEGKQVGGWTQVYGDILSYATIRGASHEAPYTQPERSLGLLKAFLEGKPLPSIE
ncbi:serine carboxypeptidase-like 45 [Glycine max]|uniref:serine carboxypeptidase-like 45 n=1 Tax=Glycine max TaxID=3847 RepID=UPI00071940AC|nr:serine carboxypeptidase-like 45 [Glycine max]|eukprot:XP_014627155.1 serine carboxypeptidase-like 45 [Glycine max]